MPSFWRSNTGKIVAGGCGSQIGAVLTCGMLAGLFSVCIIFVAINGLGFALIQNSVADTPTKQLNPVADSGELQSLLQEVDVLLGEVELLEANPPAAAFVPPAEPVTLAPQQPVAMAKGSGVMLYNGPSSNYKQVGLLAPGESKEIIGRNIDSSWWIIAMSSGNYAWVSNSDVSTFHINDSIPTVTTPKELEQLISTGPIVVIPTPTSTPTATPTPFYPPGTPTPAADVQRESVEGLDSYKKVKSSLLVPPVSASFSPDGSQVAMTERIKVYTFMTDGGYTDIWLEDNDESGPLGNVVWSPDGQYIAFDVGFKYNKYCRPCQGVGLLQRSNGKITYLSPPEDGLDMSAPRWTQNGQLLVNVHQGEPADGVAYLYDVYGNHQEAQGVFLLSSSHEGQKWYPWLPGRIWRSGVTERADSYNSD